MEKRPYPREAKLECSIDEWVHKVLILAITEARFDAHYYRLLLGGAGDVG